MKSFFELEKTNVMAEFIIHGDDFDPEDLTKKLSIIPDKCWKIGETIENRDAFRKDSYWSFNTGYIESFDINDQISGIIEKLSSKREILASLKNEFDIDYKIGVVINIESNITPAIYLNLNTIRFMHEIEAEFDVDLYIYQEEEERDDINKNHQPLNWTNPNCETTYGNTFTAYGSKLKRWEPKNKVDGKQYVQWLDDEKAAAFIAKVAQEKGEGTHEVLLSSKIPHRVILTNGKEYTGTHARIIVNPDGSVKTAYPFNRLFLNR